MLYDENNPLYGMIYIIKQSKQTKVSKQRVWSRDRNAHSCIVA